MCVYISCTMCGHVQVCMQVLSNARRVGAISFGHPACTESTLPTKPFPQPVNGFFCKVFDFKYSYLHILWGICCDTGVQFRKLVLTLIFWSLFLYQFQYFSFLFSVFFLKVLDSLWVGFYVGLEIRVYFHFCADVYPVLPTPFFE